MLRLVLFVACFLALYAGLHRVVWLGVRPLLAGRPLAGTALGLVMAAMVVAPVATRLLEQAGAESAARLLASAGYLWMGLAFLACCGFLLVFLCNLGLLGLGQLHPPAAGWLLQGPRTALLVLVLAAAAGGYGMVEAEGLVVERVRLENHRLPVGSDRLRIVQISDLHLGLQNRNDLLERLVALVKPLQADLLVATGDIVDAQINHLEGLARIFAELEPPLGKYAVIGNHEVYAGLGQATEFIRNAGFRLLRGEGTEPVPGLLLVGVDDPAAGELPAETTLLPAGAERPLVILLKHRPWVENGSNGRFDLQLSGHAHRGQIAPFNLLTAIPYPRQDGLYALPGGSHLYTSRGTGTWGPPMRVLSPPEITVIDIRRPELRSAGAP